MPDCPVNHSVPPGSKTAVLRLASLPVPSDANGNVRTSDVEGSTRTMAFRPPSEIHGAPSGPTMTPWGREPGPRSISSTAPVPGSRRPSFPDPCAVYHTVPSASTATSWGREPTGTSYSCTCAACGRVDPVVVDVASAVVSIVALVVVASAAVAPSPSSEEQATAVSTTTGGIAIARRQTPNTIR